MAPRITHLDLTGVDAASLPSAPTSTVRPKSRAAQETPRGRDATLTVLTGQKSTPAFKVMGFTWQPTAGEQPGFQVRVRENGRWSAWQQVDPSDAAPDPGSVDDKATGGRAASEPLLTGGADGVQVRVDTPDGVAPAKLQAVLVDPGTSAADSNSSGQPAASASAATNQPAIITRAQWGADESLRSRNPGCGTPSYGDTVKIGFVHHTVSTNNYAPSDSAGIVRGIYAYHVISNGWCDIGYNFLVDKYGQVFEGRYGGVSLPVVGAHTMGFNYDSFGVAAIGDYSAAAPTSALLGSIAQVIGWKLGIYTRQPLGTDTLTSAGGSGNRYPAGAVATFNVVSGHRDAYYTECPGNNLYAQLGWIRSRADAVARTTPTSPLTDITADVTAKYAGSPAQVSMTFPSRQTWGMDIYEDSTGRVVKHLSGEAQPGSATVTWDLKDSSTGTWTRGGLYRWWLVTSAGATAGGAIGVTAPTTVDSAPSWSGQASQAGFVPIAPARLLDTRTPTTTQPLGPGGVRNVQVLGVGGVPTQGVSAVALNVTGVSATEADYLFGYAAGTNRPSTGSSLNLKLGETVPGMVIAPVGGNGSVSIYNNAGSPHLVVDVVGYLPTSGGGRYVPIAPVRALDPYRTGSMAAGETRQVQIAGVGGIPASGVTGVVANVTISGATQPGNVTVFPAGTTAPTASTANVITGRDSANRTLVALGGGQISVRNVGGSARVFVDVVGYFTNGTGSTFTSVTPTRLMDTRVGGVRSKPLGPGETMSLTVAGVAGVPANAKAVVVNLTSTNTTQPSFVSAFAAGQGRGASSDLNPFPWSDVANAAVVQVGQGGQIQLYNNQGNTDLIVDLVGYLS